MKYGDLEKHGCEMHTDMPADEYHKADGLSKSMMAKLIDSPAHLRHYLDTPQESNEAFIFGQAFEDALQRPNEFYREYNGTDKWSSYCKSLIKAQEDEDKILIPQEWFETINNMVKSVHAHEIGGELMKNTKRQQLSIFWYDEDFDQLCKARLDALSVYNGRPTHVDIKTTKDAEPYYFEKDAVKLTYFLQAAHYTMACEAVDRKLLRKPPTQRDFRFLVVDKKPDLEDRHRVEVFRYDIDDIDFGRVTRAELIKLYQDCVSKNHWPYRQPVDRLLCVSEGWRDSIERKVTESAKLMEVNSEEFANSTD